MKNIISSILLVLILFHTNLNAQAQTDKNNFLITTDGTRLFVQKSGDGPICIFIHGGPGAWSESFRKLRGNNLEKRLTMVYYDQRGCGRSGKPVNGDYSLNTMIDDIDLIRQHYHAEKVYLLSHSFGGILAVNYALKYPEHVKGLILANSTLDLRNSLESQLNYINSLLQTNFHPADSTPSSVMSTFMQARTALTKRGLAYKMLSDNKENVDLLNKVDSHSPGNNDFAQRAFQIDDYWKDYTTMTNMIDVPVLNYNRKKRSRSWREPLPAISFQKSESQKNRWWAFTLF